MDTELAMRAARRAARELGWRHRSGLSGLASVASTAALVGLIGTCETIAGIFLEDPQFGQTYISIAAAAVTRALWWSLPGLSLAVLATAGYRHLNDRCDELQTEMELVLSELAGVLRQLGGTQPAQPRQPGPRQFAERAAERIRQTTVSAFGRHAAGLRTVASIAPLLGLLLTCWWMSFHTFHGFSGGPSTGLWMVGTGFSEALLFNAFGLLQAIGATWVQWSVENWRDEMDREMFVAIRELPLDGY